MLDEIARHLRAAKGVRTANRQSHLGEQSVAFLMTLIELAASRGNIVIVLTLADSADVFGDTRQCRVADAIVGRKAAETKNAEWRRVYCAFDPQTARRACTHPVIITFPENVRGIAQLFVEAHERRHETDHDPGGEWFKSEVQDRIATARRTIRDLEDAALQDRRACAVHLPYRAGS